MTEVKKKTKGSTVYVTDSTLKKLQDLKIKAWAIDLTILSDKIAQLIYFYEESHK